MRIEYDALLLACGSRPEHRKIEGGKGKSNLLYLENIYDHKVLREQLEKAKSVVNINFFKINILNNKLIINKKKYIIHK